MRLFFALWPPAETARALARWAQAAHAQSGGRLTSEDKIHLTLAFLGDVDAQRAIAAAQRVHASAHELPIEKARYVRANEMIWVAPRETPPLLKALFDSLSAELQREQFILERRPFAAHVTLIRKARGTRSLPALPAVEWPVREFVLVRSALSSSGSAYEPLERFALL